MQTRSKKSGFSLGKAASATRGNATQQHRPDASQDGRVQVPARLPGELYCPSIWELQVPEGACSTLSSPDLCTLAAHAVGMPQSLALQKVVVWLHLAGSASRGQCCLQLSLQLLLFCLQGERVTSRQGKAASSLICSFVVLPAERRSRGHAEAASLVHLPAGSDLFCRQTVCC